MKRDETIKWISRFTLNPRVSVFTHKGCSYLFDPATRTYASMNEAMLTLVKEPVNANSFDELSDIDCKGFSAVAEQLHRLGILITPGSADKIDRCSIQNRSGSMTHLAIFVTTKCNLRCVYCYAGGGDSERTISRDIWCPAMDYFFSALSSSFAEGRVKRKSVSLSIHGGGEATVEFPILKEIVTEFFSRARAAGLEPSVSIGTNGTYSDAVFQWIIENNISVNISLDGPRQIQNYLRPFRSGLPSYDVVIRNLQSLVKAGRRVSVRATVTNETLEAMEETIELAKHLGLAAVHFEPVLVTGRCATTDIARPNAEQFAEKLLRCFLLGLKYDVDVKYSGLRCFEPYHQRFCAACGHNLCVTPDGNITTCYEVLDPNDPAAREFFIGNIDPVQGQVILDQTRIAQLRLRVVENMDVCKCCFLRLQCAGECPVKSFRYSNRDLYSPDPYRCQINDRVNKQLIAWLADGAIEPRDIEQTRSMSLSQIAFRM